MVQPTDWFKLWVGGGRVANIEPSWKKLISGQVGIPCSSHFPLCFLATMKKTAFFSSISFLYDFFLLLFWHKHKYSSINWPWSETMNQSNSYLKWFSLILVIETKMPPCRIWEYICQNSSDKRLLPRIYMELNTLSKKTVVIIWVDSSQKRKYKFPAIWQKS